MSNQASLPAESPEEVARLREDLIAFYRPINSQERFAIERIALAQQSLLRVARLETQLFAVPDAELLAIMGSDSYKLFLRHQAQAERAYKCALDELTLLQSLRPLMPVAPQPAAPAPKPQLVATAAAAAPASPPRSPAVGAPKSAPAPAPAVASAALAGSAGNLALRL
jgi:hypothetical protein